MAVGSAPSVRRGSWDFGHEDSCTVPVLRCTVVSRIELTLWVILTEERVLPRGPLPLRTEADVRLDKKLVATGQQQTCPCKANGRARGPARRHTGRTDCEWRNTGLHRATSSGTDP